MTGTELVPFCQKWISRIRNDMTALTADREKALQFYRGDSEILESAKGRSTVTTSDLMDVVEWLKPSLLEIFAGNSDVVHIQPMSEEDAKPVELQNALVNHQLKVKNKWFQIVHDWLSDMLLLKMGVLKYQWIKKHDWFDKEYENLTEIEYRAKTMEPNTEVLETFVRPSGLPFDIDEMFGALSQTYDLKLRCHVYDEYPLIECVSPEDFGFPKEAMEIAEAPFVYHRLTLKKWEFIQKYTKKMFNLVKNSVENEDTQTEANVKQERFSDLGGMEFVQSENKEDYIVYECFYIDEDSGEARVLELCGDVILSDKENPYKKPPFIVVSPIRIAHRICGFSFYDLLKNFQLNRTAMMRQIYDNVYLLNNARYFGDINRFDNPNDFLNNNRPGALIGIQGDPNTVVKPIETPLMPAQVFRFWEMLEVEKDYHSGVPRSFQGVNPDVLNETWRGQREQVAQASQRVTMMARLIAEVGLSPLITEVINLNLMFLRRETSVRYLNEWIDVSPDNIVGKFDVIVNVGLGTGNKDAIILYMQQLLGLYAQMFKAGIPIVTPENVYHTMKELIKAMGFKNVNDFISKPPPPSPPQGMPPQGTPPQMMGAQPQEGLSQMPFMGQSPPPQPMQPLQPMTTPAQGGYFG